MSVVFNRGSSLYYLNWNTVAINETFQTFCWRWSSRSPLFI